MAERTRRPVWDADPEKPEISVGKAFWRANARFSLAALFICGCLLTAALVAVRSHNIGVAHALLLAAVAVAIVAALWVIPSARVAWDGKGAYGRAEREGNARGTLFQIVGSFCALATVFVAWQANSATSSAATEAQRAQAKQARDALNQAAEALVTAKRGQIADRFKEAVKLLSSRGEDADHRTTHLGGIYALEAIAIESGQDQGAVVELLATYVRERRNLKTKGPVPEDIQVILTVFRRRVINSATHPERGPVNLKDSNLSGSDLHGAGQLGADLTGCNLHGAHLEGADLSKEVGMTQSQLDSAICDENTIPPPGLKMKIRPKTGIPATAIQPPKK